ncbi:hypothetical protein V7121_09490 [Neobacillus drentensis]
MSVMEGRLIYREDEKEARSVKEGWSHLPWEEKKGVVGKRGAVSFTEGGKKGRGG